MDKTQATLLWDEYAQQDDAADLSFRQIDTVIHRLMKFSSATPHIVAQIVKQEFPEMFRPYSPQRTQQQQSTQNPTQKSVQQPSKEEIEAIIEAYLKQRWPAHLIPPLEFLANGQKRVVSQINCDQLLKGIEHWYDFMGQKRFHHGTLAELVAILDFQRRLERVPTAIERVVEKEVHVPLTRREEAKQNFALDKAMNRAESPIKGINEEVAKTPRATEEQLVAVARHDLQENETMGSVRSVIAGHSHSGSHAATKYEREILTNLMNDGIRRNVPADKILANVKAKQNAMAKWGPQQALKELRPELFTGQPQTAGN